MLKTLNVQEMIEKEVVGFGNGSIVYTPKKWIGKKVLVVLEEKPLDVTAEVLEILKPHMPKIEGIFLFGSFARNEQRKDSDIDVLVVTSGKINVKKTDKFDFLTKTKKDILRGLENDYTLFLHQAIREAKPLFNESLLIELKKEKTRPNFKAFFDETLDAFKNTRMLLEADKKRGEKYSDSNASIYSLILRLRTLFLIQCFVKNADFSNKKFFEFIKKHGFLDKTVESFFEVYRAERDSKKTTTKILLDDVEKLFEAAKIEFVKTEGISK